MSQWRRRYVSLGLVLAATLGLIYAACYNPAEPVCGFRCGPSGACPDNYACASDGVCHRNGTNPAQICVTPDAPPPVDALDAPGDALDAPPDVPVDTAIDAAIDAAVDAAVD